MTFTKDTSLAELEEQRMGRNKETLINHQYISSGSYRKKFDAITSDSNLNKLLYQLSKKMLLHRSGTTYEDMYWIDSETIKIIAQEINSNVEKKIVYSSSTQSKIKNHEHLITIHSHPDSFPPSIEDLNSNYDHNYDLGIVVCHDGKVYMYAANERINENYYNLVVVDYIKQGYNEDESQKKALIEIQNNFDIKFKEVTDDDCI